MGRKKISYKIILSSKGKQMGVLGKYTKKDIAIAEFNRIKEENANVLFPRQTINRNHKLQQSDYEIYLIKRKTEGDNQTYSFRNKYGKFVEYETNKDEWVIIDVSKYNIEEQFWVFGHDKVYDRKNYKWIREHLIDDTKNDKEYTKQIFRLKNKLIVDINGEYEIVFCKNRSDCLTLYNMLQDYVSMKKIKYIIFNGDICKSKNLTIWYKKLMDYTGFNYRKITRHNLRP